MQNKLIVYKVPKKYLGDYIVVFHAGNVLRKEHKIKSLELQSENVCRLFSNASSISLHFVIFVPMYYVSMCKTLIKSYDAF